MSSILIWLVIGLVLMVKGGDLFVDAAGWMGDVTGIPRFIIGATVVSAATTMPELIVSVVAIGQGRVEMGVGNAIGTVACNLGLVLALCLLWRPCRMPRKELLEKGMLMLGSTGTLWLFVRDGVLSPLDAVLLATNLVVFIAMNVFAAKQQTGVKKRTRRERPSLWQTLTQLLCFGLGACGVVIGAHLLVTYGAALARTLGVSEKIIGLSVLAVGTCLPELATMVSAMWKKEAALSIGNVLGANIIDICLIMPVCALSGATMPIGAQTVYFDLPLTFLMMAIAIVPGVIKGRFYHWQGIVMLGLYVCMLLGAH